MRRVGSILVSLLVAAVLWGCDRRAEASGSTGAPAAPAVPVAPAGEASGVPVAAASNPSSPVARIAFLDKENCCECTRAATDASWAALQTALEGLNVPVERIHVDTQAEQAAPYRSMQAMMAVPGIYFLDEAGGLLGMLQGEVTAAQVRAILLPAT